MSPRLQERAQKVVESFKGNLDSNLRESLADHHYEELALMITEALSDELDDVTMRMETLVQEIRSESRKGQMGM